MPARIGATIARFRPGPAVAWAWLIACTLLLLAPSAGMASAGPRAESRTTSASEIGVTGQTAVLGGGQAQDPQVADGFNTLTPGQQARSMSSLVSAGLVHPQALNLKDQGGKSISNLKLPLTTIIWGLAA